MHGLHSKIDKFKSLKEFSLFLNFNLQITISESGFYEATHADMFAVWVKTHPLIGKMLPVPLY